MPSGDFTMLPTDYLANMPPASEVTLQELLDTQERLADEARAAMPYSFDECSYSRGHVRQSVWSCLDCGQKGVCYGCSISCHGEHQLVELWTRRAFRCDCPTEAMASAGPSMSAGGGPSSSKHRCALNPPEQQPQPANEANQYGKNFGGIFCRCGRPYDPQTETEAMICCIGCEDWLHESCLHLRARPSSAEAAKGTDGQQQEDGSGAGGAEVDKPNDEEGDDEEADNLIPSDTYDGLVCAECVSGSDFLRRKAGTEGYMAIVPDGDGWKVVGRQGGADTLQFSGAKRAADEECKGDAAKKAKTDEGGASPTHHLGETSSEAVIAAAPASSTDAARTAAGDIFLAHGVREALNSSLDSATAAALPFPLADAEIYEPPADDDDGPDETIDEVTARVVGALPRFQAIEALHGYETMKNRLTAMFTGHAATGRTVSREDIEGLFQTLREGA